MNDIQEWIDRLKASPKIIVVEGIKDIRALSELGITNVCSLKNPLFIEVEKIALEHKEVIILTDLDKEGKKLYGKLKKDFARHGVEVDNKFREWLFKNTQLRQIEGIVTYLKRDQRFL